MTLFTTFYKLSVSRNLFSNAERRQFRIAGTEGLNIIFFISLSKGNEFGYQATCDLPHVGMWDTMLDEFPDCKGKLMKSDNKTLSYEPTGRILSNLLIVILVLRDEEKWITSVQKHLQVEREQFKEMSWWRNWQTLYSFIFNHSSQAMGIYMDWIR